MTQGFVGADIMSLCKEAALACFEEQTDGVDMGGDASCLLDKMIVEQRHFVRALKKVHPSTLRDQIKVPEVKWSDIGGLEQVKQVLLETVQHPIQHRDLFLAYGQKSPSGVLLYGPPGTGKTLLAKAIANECDANFMSVKGPELMNMWVGGSEKNIRELFEKAQKAAPCVIFFDELDSIGGARGLNHHGDRVLNQLLTMMDGVSDSGKVYFIGATNRPSAIDKALLRPGRLDHHIYVPLPKVAERRSILNVYLRKAPVELKEDELIRLVERTKGFSGADIMSLCSATADVCRRISVKRREAGDKNYVEPMTFEHFEEALQGCKPSVLAADLVQYTKFKHNM
jgi:transitional endoplasmic reticulum ATPase